MSAKNWIFTINNYSDVEVLKVGELGTSNEIHYLVYQLERGENGTDHVQGYVQLKKRKTLATMKRLLGDRTHLEMAKGSPGQNRDYCTKEDTRIEGPFEYGVMKGGAGSRTDISDFIARVKSGPVSEKEIIEEYGELVAKYPRFVDRVQRLYTEPARENFVPRIGWQFDLYLVLNGPVDKRKVIWYWEHSGNVGKSYFALNYSAGDGRFGYVVTGGRFSDIFYAYKNEPVVFFDWARDQEESFPYRVIEAFKNGYFLNTKYESVSRRFAVPHVVVFSNFPPDRSKLSEDRWQIKELN